MSFIDDDEALIATALNGSSYAWEKLVKRYEGRIYNYGLRLTGNATDAMDLMQEVFLGVYRNLHRFRGDAKFSSWIFRIAHNKAIDMNRRRALIQGRTFSIEDDENGEYLVPEQTTDNEPDTQLSKGQQNEEIQCMLQKLPMEQRLIVELKIYQSQTFEEISKMQEISENTAKTRFYAALKKLKVVMEESHVLS
ncbi:MAG: RNA polymerase sigma factor [Gammaproteobacteria bacterium]|nr:RNA polymerase sigma factor [Gammaproteobacteria bacterium]